MRDQLFHLEARAGATLQTQLREMLVAAIRDGQLPPGSALPSCRKLADTLAVARNTVALAYQDRFFDLTLLHVDARFDEIRGDRRFDELLQNVGLR